MAVLHAVMDSIVDNYVRIDSEVATDLDEIEEAVFAGTRHVDSVAIYRLKREVLEFKRAAVPLATPLVLLHSSARSPVASQEMRLRFRDVADHLQTVIDHVETYDRLLADVLSAHLAQVAVQQNSDMRKISAWVAIAAVPTMIAGIYGMNFDHMPELRWAWGYPAVLALMAIACSWAVPRLPPLGLAVEPQRSGGRDQVAVSRPVARAAVRSRPAPTRYHTNGRSELLATNRSSQAIDA